MTAVRIFIVFSVLLFAGLGVVGVLGYVSWDELFDVGGKLLVALVILGGAGAILGKIGPQNKSSQNEGTNKQGPQF